MFGLVFKYHLVQNLRKRDPPSDGEYHARKILERIVACEPRRLEVSLNSGKWYDANFLEAVSNGLIKLGEYSKIELLGKIEFVTDGYPAEFYKRTLLGYLDKVEVA